MARGGVHDYAAALVVTLRSTAAAYGYTLTIATTVGVLTSVRGKPHPGELFLFVIGGVSAFVVLELLLQILPKARTNAPQQAFPGAGALNLFSAAAGLGAATGMAHAVHDALAWLLAPLAATALYMLVVAAQVTLVARVHPHTPAEGERAP